MICFSSRSPLPRIAGLLALAAFTGQSYGQALRIGVDFGGRNPESFVEAGQFAGVDSQTNWNNAVTTDANGAAFDGVLNNLLSDNAGVSSVSTVDLTFTANDAWSSNGGNVTQDERLMKGILKGSGTSPMVITLAQVPAGIYNFLAYTATNANGSVPLNLTLAGAVSSSFFIAEENSFDGTFLRGTNTLENGNRGTDIDYVQWDSISPDANGFLTLTVNRPGGEGDGSGLAGFQLIQLVQPTGGNRTWNLGGGTTGTWDLITQNWKTDASVVTNFNEADVAIFNNVGAAGARLVQVQAAGVTPGKVDVNNATGNDYTIEGGPIKGDFTDLIKDGAGTLTLTGTNTFGGKTVIKAGKIVANSVGGTGTSGALGRGGNMALGDATNNTAGTFQYTGASETAARSVSVEGAGGTIFVNNAATTLTLTGSLTGSAPITKTGDGSVVFTGVAPGVTGAITVANGGLTVGNLGVGAVATTLALGADGPATFGYTGTASLDDLRSVVVGAGGGTIRVGDLRARYQVRDLTATAGSLAVTGSGRFAVAGVASFASMPSIASGATLALQNESTLTPNVLPSGSIVVSTGTLEVAPNAFGNNTAPVTLSGGTLRLAGQGLTIEFFDGAIDGGPARVAGTYANVTDYTGGLTASVNGRTDVGGRTTFDFSNNNFGDNPPFAPLSGSANELQTFISGKILTPTAGQYTFFTNSDDGSILFVDGQRVVNNNNFQGNTERSGQITLSAGSHDIAVMYYEGGGGAGLRVDYATPGGTRQTIPNSVLFGGLYNDASRGIDVTASSTIQSGGRTVLGALTQVGGSTLTLDGDFTFSGVALNGAGPHGVNIATRLGRANLGPLTAGAGTIINKGGDGVLVVSNPLPGDLTFNVNGGLLVSQVTAGVDHLAATAYTLADGAGLGFSANADTTFSRAITTSGSYRLEAGRFGAAPVQAAITLTSSVGGAFSIASGKTLSLASNNSDKPFTITSNLNGAGSVVAEQGTIGVTQNVTASGGLTVHTSRLSIAGNVQTGPLIVTSALGGITPQRPDQQGLLSIAGTTNVSSVNVTGGTLTTTGVLTNPGAFTLSGGTANLDGASSQASTSGSTTVSGGTLNVNTPFSGGAMTFTGGTSNLNNTISANSLTLSGASVVKVSGTVTAATTTVGAGSTLRLDQGAAQTRSYASGLAINAGVVEAATGTTDLGSNAIAVTPVSFSAGLLEGLLKGQFDSALAVDGRPNTGIGRGDGSASGGLRLSPRMGLTNRKDEGNPNAGYWHNDETWAYTGEFFDADGIFTWAESIDDRARIVIDGVTVVANDNWQTANSSASNDGLITSNGNDGNVNYVSGQTRVGTNNGAENVSNMYGMGPNGNGWHTIEIRVQGGGGGNGTSGGEGWGGGNNDAYTNMGIGYNPNGTTALNGSNFSLPIDNGTGNLFRVATAGTGGTVRVAAGATLAAGSLTGNQNLQLTGADGVPAVFRLNNNVAATASDTDRVTMLGGNDAEGELSVGANNTLRVGALSLSDGTRLRKTGTGRVVVNGAVRGSEAIQTKSTLGTATAATFDVTAGDLIFNSQTEGPGAIRASATGTVGGNGTIGRLQAMDGGTVAPGMDGVGSLNAGTFLMQNGTANAKLKLEFASRTSFDFLTATSGVDLMGNGTAGGDLLLDLLLGFDGQVGDVFFIVRQDGAGAVAGTFNNLPDNSLIQAGNFQFRVSYDANFETSTFGTGGNDIALLVTIPEPTAALALLCGAGLLLGTRRRRRTA